MTAKRFEVKRRRAEIDGVGIEYAPITAGQILDIQGSDPGSAPEQTRRMVEIVDANAAYEDGQPIHAESLPFALVDRIFRLIASDGEALENFS